MERISVLMSVYNESIDELNKSISSILSQTYKNIEFIIINDNPNNSTISGFLNSIKDDRVKIFANKKNEGLVCSLNFGLTKVTGEYIARMDADDIAMDDRLEKQLKYLVDNNLDMVGSAIQIIDENDIVVKEKIKFPANTKLIRKYIRWGNCIAHPTWLLKRNVYEDLKGYRRIPWCEDYDFVLRALGKKTISIGNWPGVGLKYRVRKSSISNSSISQQYVLRNYLAKKIDIISDLSEIDIANHIESKIFRNDIRKYETYIKNRDELKNTKSLFLLLCLISNKYFYILRIEKHYIKMRER